MGSIEWMIGMCNNMKVPKSSYAKQCPAILLNSSNSASGHDHALESGKKNNERVLNK
jgi:hypothetical protein